MCIRDRSYKAPDRKHVGDEDRAHHDQAYNGQHGDARSSLHQAFIHDHPAKRALSPSSSSILNNWLYFAVRSPRAGAPDFICSALVATARCEMNESSVSPERWLIMRPYPARSAVSIVCNVSDRLPIWFTLMSTELATFSWIPRRNNSSFVTKMSSPTSWTLSPRRSVRAFHPSQSSSARPSSIKTNGNSSTRVSR